MRHLFLTFAAFLLSTLMTMADDGSGSPEPFMAEGKVWYYEHTDSRSTYIYKVYFEGDTVINGQVCKKLVEERPGYAPYSYCACREDDGKVWIYYSQYASQPWQQWLLYDFTCMEGDTLTNVFLCPNNTFMVDEVVSIASHGHNRLRYAMKQKETGPAVYWLEGVGGRFNFYNAVWGGTVFGASERFYSCELNGEVIADQSSFGDAALKTTVTEEEIKEEKPTHDTSYNLQGQVVRHPITGHIYIQNRKKYIGR